MVGAGPAGLEAAQALGKRGYEVTVVEASRDLGGRVAKEARLPGLSEWIRVLDYREGQIERLPNVEVFRQSEMTVDELLELGYGHVAIATGATWRADGVGRWHTTPMPIDPGMQILTPDDLMAGRRPRGRRVVLFDDDHYYMGGVLAELLAKEDHEVTLVTHAPDVSNWTNNTLEQARIQTRVLEAEIEVVRSAPSRRSRADAAVSVCRFTGRGPRWKPTRSCWSPPACRVTSSRAASRPAATTGPTPAWRASPPSATAGRRARSPRPSGRVTGSRRSSRSSAPTPTPPRSGARSPRSTAAEGRQAAAP